MYMYIVVSRYCTGLTKSTQESSDVAVVHMCIEFRNCIAAKMCS